MLKRVSLILGPGALCGAYGAGVASVLGQHIDFYRVYGSSVGVYAATFLITQQFNIMLDIWRNHVHERLLINFTNPLRKRNILDLEYLVSLFKRDSSFLNLDKVSSERGRLVHVLTSQLSGEPEYFYPSGSDVFDSMIASSAVPYAHPAVKINDRYFYDGALSDPYPFKKVIDDGSDMLIVVSNFCLGYNPIFILKLASLAIKKYREDVEFFEASINNDLQTVLLRPSSQILKSPIDTDRIRINQTIDMGINDAEMFLKNFEAP